MRKLRAAVILLAFAAFTLALMPVQFALRLLRASPARTFPHWYHRNLCRLLGVTIHQRGKLAEDRPVLLIANHISWLDIPVLSAVAPVSFVAKSEVGTWPFISWLAKLQGTVFVNRALPREAGKSAAEIMARLKAGGHMVLFAEGTSSDGNQVLEFRSSLFAAAMPAGNGGAGPGDPIAVQSLAIGYTHQQGLPLCRRGRPIVAWYGDMTIAGHAWELLKRGPLDVHVHIGAPVSLEGFSNRKQLAGFMHSEIRDALAYILAPRRPPRLEKQNGGA